MSRFGEVKTGSCSAALTFTVIRPSWRFPAALLTSGRTELGSPAQDDVFG